MAGWEPIGVTRLRDLGVAIGELPPGRHNAITDVPGVWVGHTTIVRDRPRVARTGVTIVTFRENGIWEDRAFCGWHSFSGNGELTGAPWVDESGMLGSAVGITNTHQAGLVRDTLVRYSVEHGHTGAFLLPVVAETYDGWLSDVDGFHVTEPDVTAALERAAAGPVAEGNVGGGTGTICHEFKGGIGTSSRVVAAKWTVGVLVQANYGLRRQLRIDGIPIGRMIGPEAVPSAWEEADRSRAGDGSIVIVVATDAPLIPLQCRRLARRAVVGLGRAGGTGRNGSGDIVLAVATGNHLPAGSGETYAIEMLPHESLDPFFDAVADATEEAIVNALLAAETMTGYRGRVAHALPVDEVRTLLGTSR